MKRFYILLSLISLSVLSFSQTVLQQDFSDGTMPPSGWSFDGFASQWSNAESNSAGGTAPEAKFTYVNQIGVTHFISPAIDLSTFESITLRFNHYYDNYSGTDPKIGVATRSGGKGEWTSVWEEGPSGDIGPELKMIEISNDDVGAGDFQFCFYVDGNLYNMDYWYIDDVVLYNPLPLEAELTAITTPTYLSGPTEVSGIVSNWGDDPIVSLDIDWQVGENEVNSTTITDLSIETGDSYNFTCDQLFNFPIGTYDLNVWVRNVNGAPDGDQSNDSLTKEVNVVSHLVQRTPSFEEFTSSTCGPCKGFNDQFVPWVANHSEEITLVKYQMSWPGAGDDYYTDEGGVRRGYYGVSWVPWQIADGNQIETNMGAVNAFFDEAIVNPSFASIVGTHSIMGTTIDITTTVLPFANLSNARVHIIVFENVTTGNIGNNGETEFHHVMMKMIPDANGTSVDFTDRVPFTITDQVDLSGTFIEEYDDLGVAVIVQDFAGKTVFQSAYSLEDALFATEEGLEDVLVDGTSYPDFDTEILEYNMELPEGTTVAPLIEGIPIDENATVVVVPAEELPGATTIDVFAEDLATYQRYTLNFTVQVGIEDQNANNIKVYPNPNSGQFYISGIKDATVNIYTISGKRIAEYKNSNGNIDASELSNGIYFVKINSEENTVTKRFTINK